MACRKTADLFACTLPIFQVFLFDLLLQAVFSANLDIHDIERSRELKSQLPLLPSVAAGATFPAGQNLMVRPSLKNGTRFALTQRSKVRGATFSSLDSSETLRAESELRSLSAMDRGAAGVTGAIHRPSFCGAFQPHGHIVALSLLAASRSRCPPRPLVLARS
jgi:hypothetical protein